MIPLPKIRVRVIKKNPDWEQVDELRRMSYGRHPESYKTGSSPVLRSGLTLGVFDAAEKLLCSMRLHEAGGESLPPVLEGPTKDLLATLKLPNAFLIDKFVAQPDISVKSEIATFALCAAVLLLAEKAPKSANLMWAIAFAQKPLARRYTRVYGFKSLDPREWSLPDLSENSYYAVGNSLPSFQNHPSTHPLFRMLITEKRPDVEFSPELGDTFPV